MTGPSQRNLKVPWGHIAIKTWGKEEDSPVLMVHGILDNAGSYDRLIALLPKNFYYVCVDLPGHGLSSHFQPGIRLDIFTYVLGIKFVFEAFQWKDVIYIGHSLGAQIGILFSRIYPDRVKRLVLIDGIIPQIILNDEIISKIREEYKLIDDTYISNSKPYLYTKEELLFTLMFLRKNCLTSEAAKALFERSVTKVDNDLYKLNRDYRLKLSLRPFLSFDQYLYLLRDNNIETLIILAKYTLSYQEEDLGKLVNVLKEQSHINIFKVNGNHDVHNNHPERISELVSRFIQYLPSKL